jgi:UDP-GlcNAc:undecaprenyl-phosphate GlcNAc-1-phosphate transferase
MTYYYHFLAFLTSFGISLAILPKLSKLAFKIGLVDRPNIRKLHDQPKPLVGGIGIVAGLTISCLLFMPSENLRGFYLGMSLLFVMGILDDFNELSYQWKFLGQIFAAYFMINFSHTALVTFGGIFSLDTSFSLGLVATPLTMFCAIGVMNSINMIDGLDGLAGGVSLIALISFAGLAYMNQQPNLMLLSVAFVGAALGFLKYNYPPATLFMGDVGSFAIGFTLTFLSIAITQKLNSRVPPVAALLVLAVPIVDAITILIKRPLLGKNPFFADKTHIHHLLLRLGLSQKKAVLVILTLSSLFSIATIIGISLKIPDFYLFMLFLAYFAFHFSVSYAMDKRHEVRETKDMKEEG